MIRVHHQPLQPPLLLSSTMSNIMKAWIVGCLLLMSLPDGKHGQQITNDDQSICLQRFAKFNRKHTACVGPNRNCRISKQGITEEEKKLILDVHNYYRNLIASGNESGLGFPSAANMLTLEWDDELAYVAQKHANQCRFEHDCYDCRRTERYPVVGQNLYTYRTTRKSVEPEWRKTIKNWYEEIKIAPPQVASSFDLFQLNIGHFTQIAWAETNRIGCGYSTYQPNDGNPRFKTEQLYTCNYAPGGNYLGEKMYENGRSASKCPPQYGPARQFQALCEYIAWSSTNSNVDDGNNNNNNIDNGFRNFDEQPPPPPVSSSSATETRSNNGGGNISSTRTITTSTSRTNSNRSRTTGTGTRTSNRNNRNRNRSRTTSTSTTTSTTTTSTTTSSTTNNNNNNDNRNRNRSTNNNTNNNNNNNSNNRNRIATSDRRKNNNSNNNNNNSGGRIGSVGGTSRWSSRLNNWKNNSTSSSISATWDWKWNDSAYDWKKWLTNYTQFTNWTKWSPNANGNTGYGNNNIISNNNRPRSTIITTNNNINNNQQSPTTLSSPDQYTTSTGIPVIVVGSVGSNNNNDNNFNSNNNVPWRLTNATWWGNLTQTTNIQNLPKQRITTRLPTYTWALSLGYQKDGNNVAQPQWSRSVDLTPNYANANLYRQYSNWNWNNNNNNNNWNNRYYSNYY